jgi:hypothetical protein
MLSFLLAGALSSDEKIRPEARLYFGSGYGTMKKIFLPARRHPKEQWMPFPHLWNTVR